jgi:uncharacterized protein
MEKKLNEIEVRVLGSLIEKEITTPDYYPMTINAITNACNQKSNRDPVMALDETTVLRTLETLRSKNMVGVMIGGGMRSQKYKHNFKTIFNISIQEMAILCTLMLRGPQTLGEIRTRTERMCNFENLEELEKWVMGLILREGEPLIMKLPRLTGQKEQRFIHLLCGEPDSESIDKMAKQETAVLQVMAENERISLLENQVQNLKIELDDLKQLFIDFKKQFE